MIRNRLRSGVLLILLALPGTARSAGPVLSPPEIEEAAGVAHSAALSLVRGRTPLFEEAVDRTTLIRSAVGAPNAALLTEPQKQRLADYLLRVLEATLCSVPRSDATILSLGAESHQWRVETGLLLPSPRGYLKTEWVLRKHGPDWRIDDVRLVDIGESARDMAIRAIGDPPLAISRDPRHAARRVAVPRIAGILAVILITGIFFRHVHGRQRVILSLAALGPLLVFAVDGTLAVHEALSEPVELRIALITPRQRAISFFNSALARNDFRAAVRAEADATTLGARPQPLVYGLGRLAAQSGRAEEAGGFFSRALLPPHPAPGAHLGLAQLAATRGDYRVCLDELARYLSAARPDPATRLLEAAAQGKLRMFPEALATIESAILLDPTQPQSYDLGARLAAGAGDAALAVQRLRQEDAIRPIDRGRLAEDPAFAGIAGDPEWKEFLSETSPPAGS